MKNSRSESYAKAGVDITAGYKAVELMKAHIARTVTKGADTDIGGFGGLFELDLTGITHPVLVSGTDGVGTKLKIAFLMDKHDTVGIDCVAMCVNDVICVGAKPLYFLDYIALLTEYQCTLLKLHTAHSIKRTANVYWVLNHRFLLNHVAHVVV